MSPRVLYLVCAACAIAGFQLAGVVARGRRPDAAQTPNITAPVAFARSSGGGSVSEGLSLVKASGEAVAPRNVDSLLSLSAACEKAGSPAQARLELMEAVNRLKPDELEALLAAEAASTDFYRSQRFDFQFAARRLAEIAPEKAASLWLNARTSHFAVDALIVPWAKKSPQAFASWTLGLPRDAQKAVSSTLAQISAENPSQFATFAPQLAQSPAGASGARGAISGLISKAGKNDDPSEAIAFAQSLPQGAMRDAALAELARWPGMKLGEHPEIAAALGGLNPSDARRYIGYAAGAAERLPAGGVRDTAFSAQVSSAARKDPQKAAQRVEALSGSADYPAAVRGFVDATAAKDPAAAIEWALTISQPGAQRSAALEKAVAEYFRQKPADARKWVESAPLSREEYLMLTGRSK